MVEMTLGDVIGWCSNNNLSTWKDWQWWYENDIYNGFENRIRLYIRISNSMLDQHIVVSFKTEEDLVQFKLAML